MTEETQKSETAAPEPDRVPPDLTASCLLPPEPATVGDSGSVEKTGMVIVRERLDRVSKFGQSNHKYLREYIQFADRKAAVVVTVGTALLAYLFENEVVQRWMRPLSAWDLRSIIAFIAMFALAVAVLSALGVVVPRLKGASKGLIYWRSVARHGSGATYADAILALGEEQLARAQLEHCYELAQVCNRKYQVLNHSLRVGALGLAASVVYLLFSIDIQ